MYYKKTLTIYITKEMVSDDLLTKFWACALNKDDFKLKFLYLEYDESLFNEIKKLAKEANNVAATFSSEPYDNVNMEKVNTCICTVVYKNFWKNSSLFKFVADLYVRLVNGHYKINGNKRFAYAFLVELLWSFGYYLKFTKGKASHYEWNQEILLKIIDNKKDTEILISKWICNNLLFALK